MRTAFYFAAVALLITFGTTATLSGCFGNECDASEVTTAPMGGYLIDANTWSSNKPGENWLNYRGQRVIRFNTELLGKREPTSIDIFISEDETGSRFTPAGGNIANVSEFRSGNVTLKNNTCALEYVRIVVHVAPSLATPANTSANSDGGTSEMTLDGSQPDAAGGSSDASSDGPR
jgi:hypothetical protein